MAKARLAHVGGGFGWRGLVAGSALALAAAIAGTATAPAARAGMGAATGSGGGGGTGAAGAAGAGAGCGKVAGPFRVSGTLVLDADSKPFTSYGITVPGLQGPDWTSYTVLDLEKINAIADDWCANTVRLQLDQDDLLGPGGTVNQGYLAAIQAEVSLAERDRLVVVLNDETNLSPPPAQYLERGPTQDTETFWKILAKLYGNDPQVIFDLFNEPRMYYAGMSQAQEWQLWLNGGLFNGVFYGFGMAQLAAYVRTILGVRNLFWIEGPNYSDSFAGMVQQHALLHVSGVVYALHHPAGQPGVTAWNDDFGYLVADGIAPVVDGEWTNYEPAPTATPMPQPTSCWANAPRLVPQFLHWLAGNSIGLNAYQLQPGFLIRSYSNMAGPTTMNAKTWSCQSSQETEPGQGAGSAVMAWFQAQNG
jgi:Cellulase (glycosyl hydrolase family 5)